VKVDNSNSNVDNSNSNNGVKEKVALIDLDGVLYDFVGGVLKLKHINRADFLDFWDEHHAGTYDIAKVISKYLTDHEDFTETQMWELIDDSASDFWLDLYTYPGADHFYDMVVDLFGEDNVYFCSTPNNGASAMGKLNALRRDFGPRAARRFILTPHKHLLANAHTVLIDDSDEHIAHFKKHGGHTVLYPRVWNSGARDLDPFEHATRYIMLQLTRIIEDIRLG
jgi:hypothetical protein